MTQPQQPKDPPSQGASPDTDTGTTPHGIPDEMDHGEAKGTPDSDRAKTETAPNR